MGDSVHMRVIRSEIRYRTGGAIRSLSISLGICLLSACSLMSSGTVLYDQQDSQIGVQSDPTIRRAPAPTANSHPARLSTEDIRILLGSLMVSGWSGTLVGILEQPRPVPVFTEVELNRIAEPIALALQKAGSTERVFFSLPRSQTTYSEERTTGALFSRGRYLHLVLTDHSAFTRADTAGGNEKDLRDTKGMKLWVAGPAAAAMVPDDEEPRWAPFEKVHISVNSKDVIAARREDSHPSTTTSHATTSPSGKPSASLTQNTTAAGPAAGAADDLRLQVRELTGSNLELRDRLEDQRKQMKDMQDQLLKLQQDLESARSKTKNPRKPPVP